LAVEEILGQAERLEKDYDWLGAAESYENALKLLPENDYSTKGETYEWLGYAFYRAAFQAESNDDFRQTLRKAVADYEKAKENYQRLNDPTKTGRMLRCEAMIAYMGYWLASEASEKKSLLGECWRLTQDSLRASEESGEAKEYGKTYSQLSASALLWYCFEWDYLAGKKIIKEVADHGEVEIKLLTTVGEPDKLAKAYAKTAFALSLFANYFLDADEKENCVRKAQTYWTKAKEAYEDSARLEMLCPVPCAHDLLWGTGSQEALANLEKALEHARRTRDKFIIGSALDWLAYHTGFSLHPVSYTNSDEFAKGWRALIQYAEEAKRQYSVIAFTSPRADAYWIESPHATSRVHSGETDLGKKHDTLERAVRAGRDALEPAETSGYPNAITSVHLYLSRSLWQFAEIATSHEEKEKLLEEALQHGEEASRIAEQLAPFTYWDLGVSRLNLAEIKWGLADLARDPETRKSMLRAAILEMENATRLQVKELSFQPEKKTALFAGLGNVQYSVGGWWVRLYRLSCDKEHLRKAAEAFTEALESFQKVNLTSRMAECHWKIAQACDELDDHMTAAENFCLASDSFKGAAERIPQLKSFYEDHACYMQAWSEIERARYHHGRQEYGLAKQHFEKAAQLHKSLKQWSYLEPNYLAWAGVEDAEELSRKEQSEEALRVFEQAIKLFDETKRSIQNELGKIEDPDEKRMATSMVKATDARREYCEARIAVEEAKILDKKGDHYSSSEKYGSAAQTFQRISQTQESQQEKREIQFITTLSRAWQKMTLAEAEASPALYAEASQVFEQARDYAANEKTKMLVLGHSYFCKALEAGTTFVNTRDLATHDRALQQLASASNYYIKADFQTASEYAKATKLLFDAYLYMDNAERESDPEKKAKLYVMIERVLQTSAGSYTKAEHPEKREQMLKLLEKAKEEQELAASMTEALHAPSIVSATTAFASPTPTKEQAVGSERFEHADVQANIMARQKELKVGEDLDLEIELVNAGKGPAVLIKVTEVIPEGFDLSQKPEAYRVEDSYLNMKGKRLDPLKTEDVKLVLKPKVQGVFPLKPKILYLDENGKYKTHEPEPVTITVKELGIKGWLKGER
jgi:hypothetical protein